MAADRKRGHVSEVLAEIFRRGGMKRAVKRAEAVLLWPQVVGSEVARFTAARTLQDGILYVEVSDSETSMHLTMQRQRFLDVYRGRFGVKEVREIRFRTGRPSPPAEPAPPPSPKVDPRDLSRLARALGELDLPDTLAGPTMQAAKAMLNDRARKRALGWRPCRHCGTLSTRGDDGEFVCISCRRYESAATVRSAARRLAVNPTDETPLLGEEERAVAIHLACRYLDDILLELLPQVLADPKYRIQLESAARCRLALKLGKPPSAIDDDDYSRLDPRILRALGRWRG